MTRWVGSADDSTPFFQGDSELVTLQGDGDQSDTCLALVWNWLCFATDLKCDICDQDHSFPDQEHQGGGEEARQGSHRRNKPHCSFNSQHSSFNPLYQASDEANQFQMASDTVNFSNSNDSVSVDVSSDLIRGQYTLLHSDDDEYYGTDFDSPGWNNVAFGNRGNDFLEGENDSRDYYRGGNDDELYGDDGGNDMLFGDFGEDYVEGSWGGNNILRGSKGNDELVGGMMRDLLVGDFGTDVMEGKAGSDFFVLRTDSNASEGLHNMTPNAAEADRITDFSADDYLVITGLESHWDVNFVWEGLMSSLRS